MHGYFRRKSYGGGGNSLIVNYLQIHKSTLSKIGQNCRKLWRLCRSPYLPQISLIFTDVLDLISYSLRSRNLIKSFGANIRPLSSVPEINYHRHCAVARAWIWTNKAGEYNYYNNINVRRSRSFERMWDKNTARTQGLVVNDNRDNLRGNQLPAPLKEYFLQQHKQLYLTTLREQQHSSRSREK